MSRVLPDGSGFKRSHFELFGLAESFAVPREQLDDGFRRYQAAVHPDRHAGGSAAERRLALQMAAQGNEAHRTLADPTRRAAYLCERNGVAIDAERNTAMPPDFLAGQMQWRESIDEAREQPVQAIESLDKRLGSERSEVIARLARLIDVDQDHAAAAKLVRQLMFFDKLHSELRQLLRRAASAVR